MFCQCARKPSHTQASLRLTERTSSAIRPALESLDCSSWPTSDILGGKHKRLRALVTAAARKWLLNMFKSNIMCHSWADNLIRAACVLSGSCCSAPFLTQHQKIKKGVYGTSHSEVVGDHLITRHLLLWVQLCRGGKNHPDIASLVCYALLHAAVFVGFSCVWREAFARRASLSNKNLCRAGPVSAARRHFEYSILFVSQLSSAPCQHAFNE